MVKITNEMSKQIYEISKNPKNVLSNREIGEKFGISETNVRYHVAKNEKMFHEIAKSNDKAANGIVTHNLNVSNEAMTILSEVRKSISEAKGQGVSPEKLAPLYGNWIKSLELASEILGDIDRAPVTNNILIVAQMNELTSIIAGEQCPACKAQKRGRLDEIAGN